jgi:hypothetical protein
MWQWFMVWGFLPSRSCSILLLSGYNISGRYITSNLGMIAADASKLVTYCDIVYFTMVSSGCVPFENLLS